MKNIKVKIIILFFTSLICYWLASPLLKESPRVEWYDVIGYFVIGLLIIGIYLITLIVWGFRARRSKKIIKSKVIFTAAICSFFVLIIIFICGHISNEKNFKKIWNYKSSKSKIKLFKKDHIDSLNHLTRLESENFNALLATGVLKNETG